jgi:radical SAM modification target selenobiotic family peptide
MDKDDLKKFLAGLCIVTLVSGAGLSMVGCEKAGESS